MSSIREVIDKSTKNLRNEENNNEQICDPHHQSSPSVATVEEILRKFRSLRPEFSSGASLRIVRTLSNHFQTCHTLNLPENLNDGGYSYGATYVGKIINDNDAFPIMNGEISPTSGNFSSLFIHKISDNLIGRINTSFGYGKWLAAHLALDYQKNNKSFSIFFDKFNPFILHGTICAQYMQKVLKNLSLGFDFQIHRNGYQSSDQSSIQINANPLGANVQNQKLSLLALYNSQILDSLIMLSNKAPNLSLNLSSNFLNRFLDQKNTDLLLNINFDLASRTELAQIGLLTPSGLNITKNLTLFCDFGYVLKLKSNGCIFKTSIKNDGTLTSNADYPIQGIPLTLGICTTLNPFTSKFNTGFRISIGQ